MKKLNIAYKVSIISIIVNLILFIFKLIAGIIGSSQAMISDAIHSASDIISTIVVIIGIFISRKQSDKKHPYGHEKFESITAIVLAIMLFVIGLNLGLDGISSIISKRYLNTTSPTLLALIAATISIVIKEWMYHYTMKASIKENSTALKADAWHHRSDSLSSLGALIGIALSMIGYKMFDPLACIGISFCIIISSFDIFKDGINKIVDTSADDKIIEQITNTIIENEEIKKIDSIKTRLFGSKMYIDIEVAMDSNLTVLESHKIVEQIHDRIEENIKNCKHCMIHVNPYLNK